MAKTKKRRLTWTASGSPQVIGYKLYWSRNERVGYHSECEMLGNVTEIMLPDDIKNFELGDGPVELGVTAVDELGNESDMVTLTAPYQFNVPRAPSNLFLENLNDYHLGGVQDFESAGEEPIGLSETVDMEDRLKSEHGEDDRDGLTRIQMISKRL